MTPKPTPIAPRHRTAQPATALSRRHFLGTALGAGAGTLLAGCALPGGLVGDLFSGLGGAGVAGGAASGTPQLAPGQWEPFNRDQINQLIARLGRTSAGYQASKPPYVVMDWDNTSVFLDIEEAVLIHQLEHLVFGATPAQLEVALRKDILLADFAPEFSNAAGQRINIDRIAADILASYTWLHANYQGLAGRQPLEAVRQSPHYGAFTTKMRFLYEAISGSFDVSIAYPWVTYLFVGMTAAQVRQLTRDTLAWQRSQPIASVTWTSPASLPGRAGVVSIQWKNGLRLVPEMQDLYATFRRAGFDVWVCSASFVDVIREISSDPAMGYGNPADHVLAMELERDGQGRIKAEFRHGYDQTQGPGKTRAIQRFLVSRYGYGPSFVAGDSEGDQNMMADFADTQKVLIVNRLRSPKTDIGRFSKRAVEQHGQASTRYLLQGRNDNTGQFEPTQRATPLGASQGKLLKS